MGLLPLSCGVRRVQRARSFVVLLSARVVYRGCPRGNRGCSVHWVVLEPSLSLPLPAPAVRTMTMSLCLCMFSSPHWALVSRKLEFLRSGTSYVSVSRVTAALYFTKRERPLQAFRTLRQHFPEEYAVFGLAQLVPAMAAPVIKRSLAGWQPLQVRVFLLGLA